MGISIPLPQDFSQRGNEVKFCFASDSEVLLAMECLETAVRASVGSKLSLQGGKTLNAPRLLGYRGEESRRVAVVLENSAMATEFADALRCTLRSVS